MTWEEAVIWLKSQESQRQLVYDSYFDDPIDEAAERFHPSFEWQNIQKILSGVKVGKALDIGAGRGISTYALARDGWDVNSIEPDKSSIVGNGAIIELIEKTKISAKVFDNFGEELPFESETFDLVYMRQALHHADSIHKLCNEVFRVLKKGGTFIASREHVIDNKKSMDKFLAAHPLHHLYGGENAYKLKEYKGAITQSGMKIINVLYPFSNDVNLAPLNKVEFRKMIKSKTGITFPFLMVKIGCNLLDLFYKQPGRLFTFVCRKP